MIIKKDVGIISYAAAIPSRSISTTLIEAAQGKSGSGVGKSLGVESKTVPDRDEDTITLSVRSAMEALSCFDGDKLQISNLFIGSESHPYAVKPSGTVVKNALGLSEDMALADLEFACKAGTQGMQIGFMYLLAGFSKYSLAIGADTAQAESGDALEFTAGAGGAAYVLGNGDDDRAPLLARLLASVSIATDTPDFWRRAGESTPQHAGRFSGEPAYFYHVISAAKKIMDEIKMSPDDFDYCVFHTPNGKFPRLAAKELGFSPKQIAPSLVVEKIGNTYAGAVPVALSAVLDQAKANQKILVVSYGSGAGSDAFVFETTEALVSYQKKLRSKIVDQIKQLSEIDYEEYRATMELLAH